ncbi:hypothetical protein TcG_03984 [Trypanosoma cruzi]|nr:hypothetical protein TcBrA4_0133910 [Trypanosoma cruzi]PBJ69142.1 hypothetical protein BCY84_20324 [Trypanosoma cruzi cruzi]RNF20022.1 hypothetical protein TcG_03984 [Trypanosoma cruzi]
MSEERLDSLFDTALEAVAELERRRSLLHSSLQAAHFLYSDVQWEMDRAGLVLGLAAVPALEGAVCPQLGVAWRATSTEEMDKEGGEGSHDRYELSVVKMAAGEGKDPARWFASVPSKRLRACQQQFREVLNACVQVVQAQERALAAAETYCVAAL